MKDIWRQTRKIIESQRVFCLRRDGKDRDCFNLKKRQIKEDVTVVYRMMNDTEEVNCVLSLALL